MTIMRRIVMSRSVSITTTRSPSSTGNGPMSSERILWAASRSDPSGLSTSTPAVIMSLSFILVHFISKFIA